MNGNFVFLRAGASGRKCLALAAGLLTLVLGASAQDRATTEAERDERISSYLRAGRYAELRSLLDELLRVEERDDLENLRNLFGDGADMKVRRVPATFQCEVSPTGVVLPATVNGQRVDWLADTGANISLISDAEARRLGLEVRESGGRFADLAGGAAAAQAGIARRVLIGRTELEDVTFLVLPSDQMPWTALPPGKQGIFGLPALLALDALAWTRAGECQTGSAVPPRPSSSTTRDLRFDRLQPIVTTAFAGKPLEFVLDSGNQAGTQLWERFGTDFESMVRERGRPGTVRVTQLGGSTERPVTFIPDLRMTVGGTEVVLPEAHLFARPVGDDRFHGLLGMDILSQAASVAIDFRSMTLTLRRD